MNISPADSSHPLRRRLWKAGGYLGIFILTLTIANFFLPENRAVTRDMLGHDFLAFYAAGSMARHGEFQNLYDLTSIKNAESAAAQSAGLTVGFGPWWNPPFAAWLFAPFSLLTFSKALLLWQAFSAAALAASIFLMSRWIPGGSDWRNWGLLTLLILVSSPLLAVFTHAQNTCLTLLLMCVTVTLWRARRAWAAGMVAGLLLYKPQHAPLLAIVLIFSLGWQAAAGFAMTALALLAATLLTMPGATADYLHKLPQIALTMQALSAYAWDRHMTLKAFWRLLFQGTAAGPTFIVTDIAWWCSEFIVAAYLARLAWRSRNNATATDRLIAATIAAGPLLALFFFDYDLLILAVPAVLCAADAMRKGLDSKQLAAWIVLFIALHLDTFIARPTHFIPSTPALFALVVCLTRRQSKAAAAAPPIELPLAVAA